MMICALIYQHSYNTVSKDKRYVVLVLICNVDLTQHSKHCKKSFLYICRMMIGALSNQHSYNTVLNDTRNVALVLICNVDLAQHSKQCKNNFLYI